jgi:GDPmannose 4,6-dehydratase
MYLPTLAKVSNKVGDHSQQGLALVTGSRGQDGSYLRDLLGQEKTIGCINPRTSSKGQINESEISIDLGDKGAVLDLLKNTRPSSIFHLAARHGPSTKMPFEREDLELMKRLHVDATRNFLEAIDKLNLDTHLVVAGSSRIFTPVGEITRISEGSQPNPIDFYGQTKLEAWELVKSFRSNLGARASFLVLFNHESPRRPKGYLSQDLAEAIHRSLATGATEIAVRDASFLGDWCDARDVVALMARLAKSESPTDLVVGSGVLRSVGSIVEGVLTHLGRGPVEITSLNSQNKPDNRNSLVASNSESVKLGLWHPKTTIDRTVIEILEQLAHPM